MENVSGQGLQKKSVEECNKRVKNDELNMPKFPDFKVPPPVDRQERKHGVHKEPEEVISSTYIQSEGEF